MTKARLRSAPKLPLPAAITVIPDLSGANVDYGQPFALTALRDI